MKEKNQEYFDKMALEKMNSPQSFGVEKPTKKIEVKGAFAQIDGVMVHGANPVSGKSRIKWSTQTFDQSGDLQTFKNDEVSKE